MVTQKEIENVIWKTWHSAFPKRENVPATAKAIIEFLNNQPKE
jgi:hypothetical protein